MKPANRRAPPGFTLLEMVVALFLLSLMSLVILESYRAGLGMWEREYQGGASMDKARSLVERLRSQLKSAYPWSFRSEGRARLFFRGGRDSLEFTSLNGFSSRRGATTLHALGYSLEGDGKLKVAEYAWPRRDFPDGEEPVIGDTVEGVEEFVLAYQVEKRSSSPQGRQPGEENVEKSWVDSWPPESGRPGNETLAAVSVSLRVRLGPEETDEYSAVIPVAGGRYPGTGP